MNKAQTKGFAMATIVIAIISLLVILVLMGLSARFIPPAARNLFDSAKGWIDDTAKLFGFDLGWEEEEEEIDLDQIPKRYQDAFRGIYETFWAGKEMEEVRCLLEYPEMPNLERNAIAFEKDGGLKIFFIDDQGKELYIRGFPPISGLEPCFVAGKTEDGEIVAKNFYENWWPPEGGGGAGGGPEYIVGDVKMFSYEQKEGVPPDKLEVVGNSEIKKGTMYDIRRNPTFLYKADKDHICFMPETVNPIFGPYGCRGREAGLVYLCFREIKDKVGICGAAPTPPEKTEDERAEEEFERFISFANRYINQLYDETCKLAFDINTSKLTSSYFIVVYADGETMLFSRKGEQVKIVSEGTIKDIPFVYEWDKTIDETFEDYNNLEKINFIIDPARGDIPKNIEFKYVATRLTLSFVQKSRNWLLTDFLAEPLELCES